VVGRASFRLGTSLAADRNRVGRAVAAARDRLTASDPGLGRLRMAASGVLAMASTLGLEYLFRRLAGADAQTILIAMLMGAIVAMMGSMGLGTGSAWDKARTAAFFPVAIGVGLVLGSAVAGHRDVLLAVFVVVMFAAVFVRRFGAPFFFYGFMAWIGYFFASFLGTGFGSLPALIEDVALASAWVLLLSVTVLRHRADRILRRTLAGFAARGRAVAAAAASLLQEPDEERARRRLRSQQARLAEAALMVEGQLGDTTAVPAGWSAPALRQWLLDLHLALDGLALAATGYSEDRRRAGSAAHRPPGEQVAAAAQLCQLVAAGDDEEAGRTARAMPEGDPDRPAESRAARRASVSTLSYAHALGRSPTIDTDGGGSAEGGEEEFEPAVTLMMGNVPGSAAVARDVRARGGRWNPLARLDMTTRQAVQVAIAGALAIGAGQALSSRRYYWAVIAAFVVFTGTATRSETLIKAANRVVGTLAGLGVALVLAHVTAGNDVAILAVILGSLFLGFYLIRVSYAYMIFFITIMVAQLYTVLHEFTNELLFLRLEETAIGAGCGILVAFAFAPLSTRDTARSARTAFLAGLAELLEKAGDIFDKGGSLVELDGFARSLDLKLSQLNQVLRPLTRGGPLSGGNAPQARHRLTLYAAADTYARGLAASIRREAVRGSDRAEACRALARAATALGEPAGMPSGHTSLAPSIGGARMAPHDEPLATEGLGEARRAVDRMVDSAAGALPPTDETLARLYQVLCELAGTPVGEGADHPVPPPATPRPAAAS
jgi:uncharacterized membrane protein YccC